MTLPQPRSSVGHDAPNRRRVRLAALGLAALTFVVFLPSVENDFVNFDDHGYITDNPTVLGGLSMSTLWWAFTTGEMSNWHPLTWLSYLVDVSLYGTNAAAHHFTSVWIHSMNAGLAVLCAVALTRRLVVALPAAALFALHPLRVESVTWISERKDVLSGLFFFATILLWIASVRREDRTLRHVALASFAAGLLAKPMLVTLPALLVVVDVCFLRRPASNPREWLALIREKALFFVLAALSSVTTVLVQTDAMMQVQDYGWLSRVGGAPVHVVKYLWLTLWPAGLSPLYPLDRGGYGAATVALSVLVVVLVTGIALGVYRRAPVVLGGWLWFVGTLVPVLGLLQAGRAAVADRYTYVPHLGLFLVVSWAAARLSRFGPALLGAVAVALCSVTLAQIPVWSSSRTLFQHGVEQVPTSAFLNDALAAELLEDGEFERAEHHAAIAYELDPSMAAYATRLAQVLAVKGEGERAEALLWATLERYPETARAWFYLSAIERKDGRAAEAREHLLRALELSRGTDDKLHAQVRSIALKAGFISTAED